MTLCNVRVKRYVVIPSVPGFHILLLSILFSSAPALSAPLPQAQTFHQSIQHVQTEDGEVATTNRIEDLGIVPFTLKARMSFE